MTPSRDAGRTGPRYGARLAGAALSLSVAVAGLAGCSVAESPDPVDPAEPVALRVSVVSGADPLDESARAELERAVGDVVSEYVVRAFLGDYPREDFVRSFDSFTSGAAQSAAADIDVLTGASLDDARRVRATELDARVSVLVRDSDPVGATAHLDLQFEVADDQGGTRPLALTGRLMLEHRGGTWSVFGYDVARATGDVVEAEATS